MLDVQPVAGALGAEIHGMDLTADAGTEQSALLRQLCTSGRVATTLTIIAYPVDTTAEKGPIDVVVEGSAQVPLARTYPPRKCILVFLSQFLETVSARCFLLAGFPRRYRRSQQHFMRQLIDALCLVKMTSKKKETVPNLKPQLPEVIGE